MVSLLLGGGAGLSLALALLGRREARGAGAVLFLLQGLGLLFLFWFHLRIYRALAFPLPEGGVIRPLPPLWIEGEKLYFWAFLLGLYGIASWRRDPLPFPRLVEAARAVFLLLSLLVQNPFLSPLPGLHQEVTFLASLEGAPGFQAPMLQAMFAERVRGFYNSPYMWIHPPLLFAAYAALVPSFLGALLHLLGFRGGAGEELAYRYGRWGYLLLSAGLFLGYPWTLAAWKDLPWWWDPKVNLSIMMWIFYTAYLHLRLWGGVRGRELSVPLNLLSFAVLAVTYLATYLLPGVHSSAGGGEVR